MLGALIQRGQQRLRGASTLSDKWGSVLDRQGEEAALRS